MTNDLKALQTELKRLTDAVNPQGGLKETVTLAIGMIHRYGSGIVHVDTGRLKNSLFWDVRAGANQASASWGTNVSYSVYEEARGGSHAFVDRTVREEGRQVEKLFAVRISGGKS